MESAIFILAVLATALIFWACWDKIIYSGPASVSVNNMQHVSTTHKTVSVVPYKVLKVGANVLCATVKNMTAAAIAAESGFAVRHVTVSKRLFTKPRVTRISEDKIFDLRMK